MSNQVSIIITILSILLGLILLFKCNRSVSSTDQKMNVEETDEKMIAKHIGKSKGNHNLESSGTKTVISLNDDWMILESKKLDQASDLIQIELANVRGNADANILNVSINDKHVGQVSLFGLDNASQKKHGGEGLTFHMDITSIIRDLKLIDTTDLETLDIHVYPKKELRDDQDISIEKINIYRIKQK